MKITKYILGAILLIYFQILIAPKFEVWKIIPNFFLAYIIFLGINAKLKYVIHIAFFSGLALDLMYPQLLGFNAILFTLLVFITDKYHNSLNKDKFIIVIISMSSVNLIYFLMLFLIDLLSSAQYVGFVTFTWNIIYNTIITTLFLYFLTILDRIRFYFDV